MARNRNTHPKRYHVMSPEEFSETPNQDIPHAQVWHGLVEKTTSHGIPHVVNASGSLKKRIWFVMTLAALSGLTYILEEIVVKYMRRDVRVVLTMHHINQQKFPAVTLCNTNPFQKSKVADSPDLAAILGLTSARTRRKRLVQTPTCDVTNYHSASGYCFGMSSARVKGTAVDENSCGDSSWSLAIIDDVSKHNFLKNTPAIFEGISTGEYYLQNPGLSWGAWASGESGTRNLRCCYAMATQGHEWYETNGCGNRRYVLCQYFPHGDDIPAVAAATTTTKVPTTTMESTTLEQTTIDPTTMAEQSTTEPTTKQTTEQTTAEQATTEQTTEQIEEQTTTEQTTMNEQTKMTEQTTLEPTTLEPTTVGLTTTVGQTSKVEAATTVHYTTVNPATAEEHSTPPDLTKTTTTEEHSTPPDLTKTTTAEEHSTPPDLTKTTTEEHSTPLYLTKTTTEEHSTPPDLTKTTTTEEHSTPPDLTKTTTTEEHSTPPDLTKTTTTEEHSTPLYLIKTTTTEEHSTPPDLTKTTITEEHSTPLDLTKTTTTEEHSTPPDLTKTTTTEEHSTPPDLTKTTTTEEHLTPPDLTKTTTAEEHSIPLDLTKTTTTEEHSTPPDLTKTTTTEEHSTPPDLTKTTTTEEHSTPLDLTKTTTTEEHSTAPDLTKTTITEEHSTPLDLTKTTTTEEHLEPLDLTSITTAETTTTKKVPTTTYDALFASQSTTHNIHTTNDAITASAMPNIHTTSLKAVLASTAELPTTRTLHQTTGLAESHTLTAYEPPPTPAPVSLPGSVFPERIVSTEQFSEEEQTYEQLADISEEDKRSVGDESEELIIDCEFAGHSCNISEMSYFYNPIHGNCYTFNSEWNDIAPYWSSHVGPRYGLKVVLNINQHEYLKRFGETAGVRVVVHPQNKMPFPEDEGLLARTGQLTSMGLRKVSIQKLGDPYTECEPLSANDITKNVYEEYYNVDYTTLACHKTCYQRYVIRECGCSDPGYPSYGAAFNYADVNACKSTNIVEDDCKYNISKLYAANELDCHCVDPCVEDVFLPEVSVAQWPSDNSVRSILKKYRNNLQGAMLHTNDTDLETLDKNLAKLQVYFQEFQFEKIQEIPSYQDLSFVTDISGSLGLWIGWSLITIFEFVELIIDSAVLLILKIKAGKYKKNKIAEHSVASVSCPSFNSLKSTSCETLL